MISSSSLRHSETLPLLSSRPRTPPNASYLQAPANAPPPQSQSQSKQTQNLAQSHGWLTYTLPDTITTYHVHPTLRAVTDIDLADKRKLGGVTASLGTSTTANGSGGYSADTAHANGRGGAPVGMEIWLVEPAPLPKKSQSILRKKKTKEEPAFVPVRCWVDHKKKQVLVDSFDSVVWNSNAADGARRGRVESDDGEPFLMLSMW